MDRTEDAGLWRRWRSAAGPKATAEPDPLLLAAYAEHRLGPEEAAEIEDWLAAHPAAIEDILAAGRTMAETPPAAPASVVARASALIAAGDDHVVAFRRPAPRAAGWGETVRWAAMAASILVTSLVGFTLGNDTYANLAGPASQTLVQEFLDPPAGLFGLDEDQSI